MSTVQKILIGIAVVAVLAIIAILFGDDVLEQ